MWRCKLDYLLKGKCRFVIYYLLFIFIINILSCSDVTDYDEYDSGDNSYAPEKIEYQIKVTVRRGDNNNPIPNARVILKITPNTSGNINYDEETILTNSNGNAIYSWKSTDKLWWAGIKSVSCTGYDRMTSPATILNEDNNQNTLPSGRLSNTTSRVNWVVSLTEHN